MSGEFRLVNADLIIDLVWAELEKISDKNLFKKELSYMNEKYYNKIISDSRLQVEVLLKDLKFLNTLKNAKNWSQKWINDLKNLESKYAFESIIEKNNVDAVEKNASLKVELSFTEYLTTRVSTLRNLLEVKSHPKDLDPLVSPEYCFRDLNYVLNIDAPYNKEETFFIKNNVLCSHSTCCFAHTKEKGILDFMKVYRRETVDKTHLCEFTQLEYKKLCKEVDPVLQLKKDVLIILKVLGVDIEKVSFRSTRYPYTNPSFEILYSQGEKILELGGCGLYSSYLNNEPPGVYLAAGLGVERCYMIYNQLNSINQVHKIIH